MNEDTAEKLEREYEVSPATIRRDGQFARLLDGVLQQAGVEDKRWQLLGGDVKLNRSVVKRLADLKGKELKKQVEHLLKHGRLLRTKQAPTPAASPKAVAKSSAESFVTKLKAKDEKLPVAVLKEMALMLGFKLMSVKTKKKG